MTQESSTMLLDRSIILSGIPLEKKEIHQSLLNIENKARSNLFTWNGQFSPQLVEVLLEKYADTDSVILDPFAGSGTILYESGRKGLAAFATEINPAAYYMASTYELINVPLKSREKCIRETEALLQTCIPASFLPMFENGKNESCDAIKAGLLSALSSVENSMVKKILQVLVVRLDFYKNDLTSEKVFSYWEKLKDLIVELPFSTKPLLTFNCDARQLPLPEQSVDVVITSPPYINVFNYHQQYRASTETLGWNLLQVAKSEIGSNRKHRSNRFLTVIQYCLDLTQVFTALSRVVKESAKVIFVVGRESRVRGVPFLNGDIVSLIATECAGYNIKTRQERVFKNKFGEHIFEDILHFSPGKKTTDNIEKGQQVAQTVLEKALKTASADVYGDLKDALNRLPDVAPSDLFSSEKSFTP